MPGDMVTQSPHSVGELDVSSANVRSRSVEPVASNSSNIKRRKRLKYLCCRCFKHRRTRHVKDGSNRHPSASSNPEDQGSPFIQSLLNPDYSCVRKVSWCLVMVTCTCVCLWQLGDRIRHYFDEPIMYQVSVVRQHEVQFPAITFCPARAPFNDTRWENLSSDNFSLNDAWSEYEIKMNESMYIYAACNEDQTKCDFDEGVNIKLNISVLPTFYGKCLTILPGRPLEYRGASSFMEINLRPGPYNKNWFGRDVAAQFFFQESNSRHRHEAYYLVEWWSQNRATNVHLSLKQFDFLNTSSNPCDDEATVTECKNQCVDKLLDKTLNCSLPFMVSKLPACGTPREAKQAMDQCLQFYQSFSYAQCPCRRQCIQKVYSYSLDAAERVRNDWTVLLLQFTDNLVENVTENYAYSFSALVSDIGGGLGFFLGVSILSVLKAFEIILDKLNPKY